MISLGELKKVLPQLNYNSSKGSNGTIGVIGGSIQYTGAPYYTAMSALKMGADLAHIFCSKQSAIPIKSYSPQLIVHPVFNYDQDLNKELSQEQVNKMVQKWIQYFKSKLERISCWVVGPGLGRSQYLSKFFFDFIKLLPKKTNIVIDADGLYFLCKFPQLQQNLKQLNCILTPNHREFFHLNKLLKLQTDIIQKMKAESKQDNYIPKRFKLKSQIAKNIQTKNQNQIAVIVKGYKDIIFNKGNYVTVVETRGGFKRCGGIGDILAGCLASCYLWNAKQGPVLACHIVKLAAERACKKHGRSLTAPGVLDEVQNIVKEIDDQLI